MESLITEVPYGLEAEHEMFSKLSDEELCKRLKEGFTREECCYGMIIFGIVAERYISGLKGKIMSLNYENENLRNHILSAPEGSLYFEAKNHYENLNRIP